MLNSAVSFTVILQMLSCIVAEAFQVRLQVCLVKENAGAMRTLEILVIIFLVIHTIA
jgi:hypothetical protein